MKALHPGLMKALRPGEKDREGGPVLVDVAAGRTTMCTVLQLVATNLQLSFNLAR